MRSVLQFDGSARDLLVDFASSGGATLFLDGLDFFSESEQLTERDLVYEASTVPSFRVVATARRDFGSEQPSFLPGAAVERLGRANAIAVDELSPTEVSELKASAPELGSLLAESHPARAVTRNLFRLSRLANRLGDEHSPRTEVDMAEQWWKSADGPPGALRRKRARVIKDVTEQTLDGREPLDTTPHPEDALEALEQSQTLRDLGDDHMAFYHDVLRDWAVANLLYLHPDTRDRLILSEPAPASLVRGVELAARMALERHRDDSRWREWVDRVSGGKTHGSWRRAAILAPVRSEIHSELLERVSGFLLSDHARVLRELARTVIAIDGRPATEFVAHDETDGKQLYVPSGPSWIHLIRWLLSVGKDLPAAAIPDVVRLYYGWYVLGIGFPRKIHMLLSLFRKGGRISPSEALKQYESWYDMPPAAYLTLCRPTEYAA